MELDDYLYYDNHALAVYWANDWAKLSGFRARVRGFDIMGKKIWVVTETENAPLERVK